MLKVVRDELCSDKLTFQYAEVMSSFVKNLAPFSWVNVIKGLDRVMWTLNIFGKVMWVRADPQFTCVFLNKYSPFITLCLGSIELDHVISELCYKGIILLRNYRKMTIWEPRPSRDITQTML